MDTFWTVGVAAALVMNIVLAVVMLGVIRELGVVLVRIGPAYARPVPSGPKLEDVIEPFAVADINGLTYQVRPTKFEYRLLLFVSPGCPGCTALIPGIKTLAKDYADRTKVFAISSGERTPQDLDYARAVYPHVVYTCDPTLHEEFGVDGTPYAFLLDSDNMVVSKGIVNHLGHLESLFTLEAYQFNSKRDEAVATNGAVHA